MSVSQSFNNTVLYLPSTPLNILLCLAHAVAHQNQQTSIFVLIDQPQTEKNAYFLAIQQLINEHNLNIERVLMLPSRLAGLSKLATRKQNFAVLKNLVEKHDISVVATGSDRRIEFQYAMQQITAKQGTQSKPPEGWYMDDGLYSYAGRKSVWHKDLFGSFIKKITYGFWWQEPREIGTSSWIAAAWLFDSCKAILPLKKKPIYEIKAAWFFAKEITQFSEVLLKRYQISDNDMRFWLHADLCVLLPHPNNIEKMPAYAQRLKQLLKIAEEKNLNVVVKYHPRTQEEDLLGLKADKVKIIPSAIAFEFILMKLGSHLRLIGDVGTSLLTAKWLRPDIAALAIMDDKSAFENQFKRVLQQHGVKVKSAALAPEEWLL